MITFRVEVWGWGWGVWYFPPRPATDTSGTSLHGITEEVVGADTPFLDRYGEASVRVIVPGAADADCGHTSKGWPWRGESN